MAGIRCPDVEAAAFALTLNRRRMLRGVGLRAFALAYGCRAEFYPMRRHSRMPAAPDRQRVVGGSTTVG